MVHGYHFILSAYGFWLPNDPRGSWSTVIRQFDLLRFGSATKLETTRSVAAAVHDSTLRSAAKRALKYPAVRFTGEQALAISRGFAVAADEREYAVFALAILPDHVHLVIARHDRHVDEIASHLKAKATFEMSQRGIHPLVRFSSSKGRLPSPWARNHWCPFIRSHEHMVAAIEYVERNPIRAGLRRQRWSLVTPYGAPTR